MKRPMTYTNKYRRNRQARLRYINDERVRESALDRSKQQRQRIKDNAEYREKRNEWQRRYRRKRRIGATTAEVLAD